MLQYKSGTVITIKKEKQMKHYQITQFSTIMLRFKLEKPVKVSDKKKESTPLEGDETSRTRTSASYFD